MIDLKKFPKLGVRVPVALKRRVRQLGLDMETQGVPADDELTMESIFAVGVMALLEASPSDQAKAFAKHLPELLAMFKSEMPATKKDPAESEVPKEPTTVDVLGELPESKSKQKRRG